MFLAAMSCSSTDDRDDNDVFNNTHHNTTDHARTLISGRAIDPPVEQEEQ